MSTRLTRAFSTTNPGVEYQTAFASIYEGVKGDPDIIDMNGFDRLQLSNSLLNNAGNSAYNVFIPNDTGMGNVKVGAVVTTIMNEVTGKAVDIQVNPWLPQGNRIVRSVTLPMPQSNVRECFAWAGPQDYAKVNWAPTQFTSRQLVDFDWHALLIRPQYSAVIAGITGTVSALRRPDPSATPKK